jgi:CCR4-NOT transcription complex subunit 9
MGMEQGYDLEAEIVEQIANLRYPEKREDALLELSKKRDTSPKLATLIWYSVGTVAIL